MTLTAKQFTELEASGDSYGSGVGSADGKHGFNSILAAMLGTPLRNHSIGGAVAAWQSLGYNGAGDGGYANVLQTVGAPNAGGPYKPQRSLGSLVYGFNDLWNNGKAAAIPRGVSAMRLMISRYRSAVNYPVSVLTGVSAAASGSSGLAGDGQPWLVPSGGNLLGTFTCPADMPSGAVVVFYGACSAGAAGTIQFAKNWATLPQSINVASICNDPAIANVYNGWCQRLTGMAAGDQIEILISPSAGVTALNGVMIEPVSCTPVLVQNCPHVPADATAYGWASQAAMFADIDSWNSALSSLCAEFADGRALYYDVVSTLGSVAHGSAGSHYVVDNLHPDPEGHSLLAQAAFTKLGTMTPLTTAEIADMALFPPERVSGPDDPNTTVPQVFPYTMALEDRQVICNGSGARAVALPDAMLATVGAPYYVLDAGPGSGVAVSAASGQQINGSTSSFSVGRSARFVSTGTGWVAS